MTILGTRPEIIRLNLIIKKLDQYCKQVLVHTGQNYDFNLNDIFLKQLDVRPVDYFLGARGTFGEQIGTILREIEAVMLKEKPDRFLVLGDTNSSMAAIMAKRLGIPVYHMEAGNRCYDDRVPEEVNRRIIDHSSDVLMPYTDRSRENLLAEGIPGWRIYVTGNPIKEVIDHYKTAINGSPILDTLKLTAGKYFLVTLHRAENVDPPDRLKGFMEALNRVHREYKQPIVCSLHPRTRKRLDQFNLDTGGITLIEPQGFFEFIHLEKKSRCVLSDSGTVQEECCIMGIPSVTLRDVTERPETIDSGGNILAGGDPERIMDAIKVVLNQESKWTPPEEYMAENVSDTVVKIAMGYNHHVSGWGKA
jgi:UDP-N-acetylglucosamine 2-epimerase (non-hydrolysing)